MSFRIQPFTTIPVLLLLKAQDVSANLILARASASNNSTQGQSEHTKHDAAFIAEACLIPVLVILSGILAGLTLGYMSLDETQLRVLSVSGTPKQKAYAQKIQPIRKNGHLLLTTLLLGNMIVNETLPVLSEKVLGGGIQAVVVSTVLIVVFSEIIPQSLCSRFGLQIGAFMAVPTQILIYFLFIVSWPIAKLLEFALGPHHGIVYRRNELKELINMHSAMSSHGGDLQSDTVTMVGGALDFQEKTVKDAMTPIDQVFMLSIDSKLDYETLAKVVRSGHSRVPVYEEVKEVSGAFSKKIVGILLVKQCVLLDPEDATPLRDIPLNTIPTVPFDEPLHLILDRFQQGNSHMAAVSRIPSRTESKAKPGSVNEESKIGLTRRFLNRVGLGEDSSGGSDSDDESDSKSKISAKEKKRRARVERKTDDAAHWKQWNKAAALEQTMPSDAILTDENAVKFLEGLQRSPLGIITLEDVIEELIGEEILDEFDLKGVNALAASTYVPAEAQRAVEAAAQKALDEVAATKLKDTSTMKVGFSSPSGTNTPTNGSTSNLRVAQGIRAIRMAASGTSSPKPTKRSSSLPGTKRTPAPSSGADDPVGLRTDTPVTPIGEDAASSSTGEATVVGGGAGLDTNVVKQSSLTVPPSIPIVPPGIIAGDEGLSIPKPGTPKKRAFKSLIAGESATPGLEKRSDPLTKESGKGE